MRTRPRSIDLCSLVGYVGAPTLRESMWRTTRMMGNMNDPCYLQYLTETFWKNVSMCFLRSVKDWDQLNFTIFTMSCKHSYSKMESNEVM